MTQAFLGDFTLVQGDKTISATKKLNSNSS